jgi:choline dehydrogenase-like flavoprotein
MDDRQHYTVVVIGTGFGGMMTTFSLARELKERRNQKPDEAKKNILMLERGTWWTTPVGTVQDKKVETYDFLANKNNQPVQYWPSQNTFKGVIDIVTRCLRRGRNKDGLYDLTALGWKWPLSLFRRGDGVTILRANGVGGGSLVYSNITIRPPDLIFNDPRWPIKWDEQERHNYYNLARDAIGYGVIVALEARDARNIPYVGESLPIHYVNAGLSNIVSRSARLNPHWKVVGKGDPFNPRGIRQVVVNPPRAPGSQEPPIPDRANALWVDRARVFQAAIKQLTDDFGAVDLAINDLTPEGAPLGPKEPPANYPLEKPVNYCERRGRCNVGCLPGARHTLNKQLMPAVFGKPDGTPPLFDNLNVRALAEVDFVKELDGGGYEIHYDQYEHQNMREPGRKKRMRVTADKVIVAAGCMGTTAIMLRSKEKGGLLGLGDAVGLGFSTNGDYIAFMEETKERVSLTRGPVTSSFGHFNTDDPGDDSDPEKPKFHTLEDQGIPPAFASLVGVGLPVIRSLTKGRNRHLFLLWAILLWALKQARLYIRAPFVNSRERQEMFKSEEEASAKMMCVVATGREATVGQFRLGGRGQTSLRVKRTDDRRFHKDPVYKDIERTLRDLEPHLRAGDNEKGKFRNPFLSSIFRKTKVDSITLSHPLGGCRMAEDIEHGVVDEYGRVFDKRKRDNEDQEQRFYEGLYIADGAIVPTALGVNPSLTISALALRIADKIIEEL